MAIEPPENFPLTNPVVIVGGNRLEQTPGVFWDEGTPFVFLEVDQAGRLLLTAEIYGSDGEKLGVLRRNAWPYSDDACTVRTNPGRLQLHGVDGRLIFSASVIDEHTVSIDSGELYSPSGHLIEINSDRIQVGEGGHKLGGNTFRGCAALLDIRDGAVMVGVAG